jgi:hypothetical protein
LGEQNILSGVTLTTKNVEHRQPTLRRATGAMPSKQNAPSVFVKGLPYSLA